MNTSNLYVSQVVKNYKELCNLLGEKVKSGDSKNAQLKKFNNYFEYNKDGNKFIITKVYNEKDLKLLEIKRGRKTLYGNMIQILLMDMLSKNKGNLIISKSILNRELGLVNNNYSIGYNNQLGLSNHLNIGIEYVNDFYNINNSNINKIVRTALNSLHSKRIIDFQQVTMIKYYGEKQAHISTNEDRSILTEIDKEVMLEFDIKSLDELNKYNLNKNYFNMLKYRDGLIRDRTNIEYHYKAYDIVINHKYIKQEQLELTDYVLNEVDRLSTNVKLNEVYSDNSVNNAIKRNVNSNRDICKNENYIDYFKNLTTKLIKLDSEDISISDLRNIKYNLISDDSLPF